MVIAFGDLETRLKVNRRTFGRVKRLSTYGQNIDKLHYKNCLRVGNHLVYNENPFGFDGVRVYGTFLF